jgi:hypothetical protein
MTSRSVAAADGRGREARARRFRGSARWLAAACAVALVAGVLVAVFAGGSSNQATRTAPHAPKVLLAALRDIGPDGLYSKDAALRLYGLLYGPLPGTASPRLRSPKVFVDGTIALSAVYRVRDQLTAQQQTAFDEELASNSLPGGGGRFSVRAQTQPPNAQQQELDRLGSHFAGVYRAKLGAPLRYELRVQIEPAPHPEGRLADAWTYGPTCLIRVYPQAFVYGVDQVMAHEVFHCFQFQAYGGGTGQIGVGRWIIEGGAEWADAELFPNSHGSADFWPEYLTTPRISLFARTYDAKGFYAYLKASGTDPWMAQRRMWREPPGANELAFTASGANGSAFLDNWASGLARTPSLGGEWDTTGPGITANHAPLEVMEIHDGQGVSLSADPYTNFLFRPLPKTDVLSVGLLQGTARLSDGSVNVQLGSNDYCTRDGGCECPAGSEGSPPTESLGKPYAPVVALTGVPGGGTQVGIAGHSLDDFCKHKAKNPPLPPVKAGNCPSAGTVGAIVHYPVPGPDPAQFSGTISMGTLYCSYVNPDYAAHQTADAQISVFYGAQDAAGHHGHAAFVFLAQQLSTSSLGAFSPVTGPSNIGDEAALSTFTAPPQQTSYSYLVRFGTTIIYAVVHGNPGPVDSSMAVKLARLVAARAPAKKPRSPKKQR